MHVMHLQGNAVLPVDFHGGHKQGPLFEVEQRTEAAHNVEALLDGGAVAKLKLSVSERQFRTETPQKFAFYQKVAKPEVMIKRLT